ncbi:Pls/PosA family non-ribosomal peptide synthetase [Aeromicrobium sp. Root495]|uniref:Pls/PosA family non-ribosomal peptide synthetase n=1 Tax=Aeromicrobium sp. Root495 TaxID=1736550 RepID=UPI000B286E66|nr:Pls/PosA family non-ribosomal peptide synthetase [Aeromicrobium sp. Root495]
MPEALTVPPTLLRGAEAPAPRTLVEIFRATLADAPDVPALDNGSRVLTYAELEEAATAVATDLADVGVGRGDRVGVRITSGTTDLYVAILGVLHAGAAYVPVDVDDPDERARTVFGEAGVAAVIGDDLRISTAGSPGAPVRVEDPELTDDAWIIFTSGSTGTPKGVAVQHRSAAAFVDAEASMFLQEHPLGPGDRVMAGLSVAFDASCEEMWLAWRYGACLVPAPRSLVKSGTDLGPWLVANDVTVVSTVPTLVSLWPTAALDAVRLLILGGEACPPEIGLRLATPGREVWNTYGPTEATVVACGARVHADEVVRIGLPLAGWDLAVVDAEGVPVAPGEPGELMIGGVGLARYLDADKDAEKYAPAPALGWDRAYRSGDVVRFDGEGLVFQGRADDQIKIGGRRIELGEIDDALLHLPGVVAAAAAVRTTSAGNKVLVGYVTVDGTFDAGTVGVLLRERLPASNVPRLAVVPTVPVRTSGKVDRDALPWPVAAPEAEVRLEGTAGWVGELWLDILGAVVSRPQDDFFALGGSSLMAAQLVARLRERFPEATVADVYEHSSVAGLAAHLDAMQTPSGALNRSVPPVPLKTQLGQLVLLLPFRAAAGLRWLTWVGLGVLAARSAWGWAWLPEVPWVAVVIGLVVLVSPVGRMVLAVAGARLLLRGVEPGEHPRGGKTHLRLWAAERWVDEVGAESLASSGLVKTQARLLGATIGKGVDLHTVPPVTGWLTVGDGASVEPEVDLRGWWIDGATLRLGPVRIGESARIGVRSLVGPGVTIGDDAEVVAGSTVLEDVPEGQYAAGAPARVVGESRGPLLAEEAPLRPRWAVAYALTGAFLASLPLLAAVLALAAFSPLLDGASGAGDALARALVLLVPFALLTMLVLATLVLVIVRLQSLGLRPGLHAVHGRQAWQAWTVFRVLDEARTWLFPLYSSSLTPVWLRLLGARIGPDVEASTVLMLPSMTTVGEGAFLADDTMLGMYELGGGWLRVEPVKIGRHAFVGNSGMTAPGRKVPKRGLVAVLSAAPRRTEAKKGTSWLGSPPTKLRRSVEEVDRTRTYEPPLRLRAARAGFELARLVAVVLDVGLVLGWATALLAVADGVGWWLAMVLAGPMLAVAGLVAATVATAAKWLLVGRVRAGEHPLWSTFVWRNELADTFVEVLAARWFCGTVSGTVLLTAWLRTLGASIGRGVWCESYWLPEADLVHLGDGVTVNRGCVVQTHLFHDRILSMDTVELHSGATLGPHGVVLPAASAGRHATVGPGSLVMRGESVPARTRWIGNPIGPWNA